MNFIPSLKLAFEINEDSCGKSDPGDTYGTKVQFEEARESPTESELYFQIRLHGGQAI